MIEIKRKCSKSTKDIPKNILEELNFGQIETAKLVCWLPIDQRLLLENLFKQADCKKYLNPILTDKDCQKVQSEDFNYWCNRFSRNSSGSDSKTL